MAGLVLITRPAEDAQEIADILKQRGYQTFLEPMLEVVYHRVSLPDLNQYKALIFTSRNAVRAFTKLSNRRDIKIHTVGSMTAELAKEHGFSDIVDANSDVEGLIELLVRDGEKGSYWYGRGEEVARSLQNEKLALENITIDENIIYSIDNKRSFSDELVRHIHNKSFSHVLFFSTRTSQVFVENLENTIGTDGQNEYFKGTKALCIGTPMIRYLSEIQWENCLVAEQPNRQALLALL